MDVVKENIENLARLWQTVGERAHAYYSETNFSYCKVDGAEWPNRLWFHNEIDKTSLESAMEIIAASPVHLKVSCWDVPQKNAGTLLEDAGFTKASEQFGMALKLNGPFESASRIDIHRVENKAGAILWSELFQKAFNYQISPTLVEVSFNDIGYFIASHNGQPVGTCILYSPGSDVVGVHSLGIIPEMRRKGYAEEIMKQMLHQSVEDDSAYAVLQASEMAKPMYEKLGFSMQFMMYNYQLNN